MPNLLERLRSALSDRYTVERELGRGGMAIVYLAEDVKHHRPVAIKVLQPELAAALGPERFLREIEVTARLNHPHILPLLDSGEAAGLLFCVMPYVEGESLRERLEQEKQLPLEEALRIAAEVADALSFAHGHDVLHRDIKPENILLEGGHAVVADFGLARAISAAGGTRLTETGMAVGTPEYMSPEQPPFTGPTIESVARQHLSAPPPSVTLLRAALPAQISQSLMRALAKAPADRFHSAAEFGGAIAPHGAVTPSGDVPVERRAMRRRVVVGGAAVLVVATITLVANGLLSPRGRGAGFDRNRVLVVAFADQSGLGEFQSLGSWAQDHVIQVLTEAGFAEVVDPQTALASSRNLAAAGIASGPGDIQALADQARAGTVVSGSYYAEGDSLHIQTRITDASDGRLMGTVDPIIGSIGARSELVTRLGQQVVAALAPLLDQELGSFEPTVRPAAYEAYEAYSEGLFAYVRADWYGEDAMLDAARHFERAVVVDPTFSRARLWAAQTYFRIAFGADGWSRHAKAESLIAPLVESREQLSRYERCRLDYVIALGRLNDRAALYDAARCMVDAAPGSDDAKRELALQSASPRERMGLMRELDPDRGLMRQWGNYWCVLSQAYGTLGDYEADLEVAQQGRERFPETPHRLMHQARALAALGRSAEAAAVVEMMRSLPSRERLGYWIYQTAHWIRPYGHQALVDETLDAAIAWYRSRPQDTEQSRAELADLLYEARRWEDALQVYQALAEQHPENSGYLGALGRLAVRRGDREGALRVSGELRTAQYPPIGTVNAVLQRARIAALLGDRDEAVTLARTFVYQMPSNLDGRHLRVDIDFESLHDYPPFQELMRPKG